MAKRLDSTYQAGLRSNTWLKIKARKDMLAIVVGYELNPNKGLKSLVIAAVMEGELRCVGQVGSGLTLAMASEILPQLQRAERDSPVVPCKGAKVRWVEPRLCCRVSYAEVLESGKLRQPVFEAWVETPIGLT